MSAYCTQSDLVARFGEAEMIGLTDRTNAGTIDAAIVAGAIGKASDLIDGYIGGRYALPLASTPPLLKGFCEDLARHALYTVERPKNVDAARDAAIAYLKDVATGRASLGTAVPLAAAPAAASGNEILFEPGDRGMSRAELRKL